MIIKKGREINLVTDYIGVGRRKSSVARVRLLPGTGKFRINNVEGEQYLQYNPVYVNYCLRPLNLVGLHIEYDIYANVKGGGLTGQAGAVSLGVSRAICNLDENYREILKAEGYLTRDPRKKERRKYGLKKARKSPQYSKR